MVEAISQLTEQPNSGREKSPSLEPSAPGWGAFGVTDTYMVRLVKRESRDWWLKFYWLRR